MGQAWSAGLLPIVECYLPSEVASWGDFTHRSTRVRDYKLEGVPLRHGETVWTGTVNRKLASVGWEWAELRPGVVGLLHPNSIATNLRFLAHKTCRVSMTQAIVDVNRLIHSWPWQSIVQEVLQGRSIDAPDLDQRRRTAAPRGRALRCRAVEHHADRRLAA